MGVTRVDLAVTDDGAFELVAGYNGYFLATFLDENKVRINLDGHTLAVAVKYANGDVDTWTITARDQSVAANLGLADITAPKAKNTTARSHDTTKVNVNIVFDDAVVRAARIALKADDAA